MESAKRSQTTHLPAASAGSIAHLTWSSRAAANSIASASGPNGFAAPDKQHVADDFRARRAAGLAGEQHTAARGIPGACASISAWVDLPVPSPPSKVMNFPRPLGLPAAGCSAIRSVTSI